MIILKSHLGMTLKSGAQNLENLEEFQQII